MVAYLYLSRMVLGNFLYEQAPHVESCAALFCLLGLVLWDHRYPHPFLHPLVGLEGSAGFYYRLHEGFYLLIYQ